MQAMVSHRRLGVMEATEELCSAFCFVLLSEVILKYNIILVSEIQHDSIFCVYCEMIAPIS